MLRCASERVWLMRSGVRHLGLAVRIFLLRCEMSLCRSPVRVERRLFYA